MPPPAHRRAAATALAIALAFAPVPPAPGAATRAAAATAAVTAPMAPPLDPRIPPLRLPVWGMLVRGFEAPAGPYGPGHRGVDLRAPVRTPVAAPAAGTVGFAGRVAGASWVSVLVAPGVVVTVGRCWRRPWPPGSGWRRWRRWGGWPLATAAPST